MTDAMPNTDRLLVGAALIALAEATMHNLMVLPDDIDLVTHGIERDTFLSLADQYEVPIEMRNGSAWINVPLATVERNGVKITHGMFSAAGDGAAMALYATHNAECLAHPCAGGKCPDPAAHAEGAHDL